MKPGNCPDKEKQEEMVNKLKIIKKQCKKGKAKMLFEDAVHQLHTTSTGYAIQFKGKANTKVLQSNTGRNRFTILGTIDPYNGEFISVQTKATCNIELMKLLLKAVADKHQERIKSGKKLYLILDNARYQKAYEVQNYAKELGISLQYLPPYCPHLNIIERLRKRMKKKLRNIYFPTFEIFCNHILDILSSIEKSFKELKGMLRLRFGII